MAQTIYEIPENCKKGCHISSEEQYKTMWEESVNNPEKFWGDLAKESIEWFQPFTKVKSGELLKGDIHWFRDGKLNACYNCVDRWLDTKGDQNAIIWEGDECDEIRHITYKELHEEVCRLANVFKKLGLKKGDTVAVYMPNSPEAAFALLACARIGVVHSVVFAGFSADALANRINDANFKLVFIFDEGKRGGRSLALKKVVDEAVKKCPCVEHVLVHKYTGNTAVPFDDKIDVWMTEAMAEQRPYCPCEWMDAEDTLFLLYTSGSTGQPKGMMHTIGGFLTYAACTTKYTFDVHDKDIFACVADVGWITGHSYIVYGPLAAGTTTFMFMSTPMYPNASRYWDMVQRHKITQFYTAPTAIRALMKFGDEPFKGYDLSSLKVLGSVGEPINPEAWRWYFDNVGKGKCSIVDTYWQTESGGHLLTPLPGVNKLKPGSCTSPFFGVQPVVLDATSGKELEGNGITGLLAIKTHWPGIARSIYNNHERYLETYMKPYPGYYFTGDGVTRDDDGYYWIGGRVDDVINVSGHRLGTAEIESALVGHKAIAEAAVIGIPHDVKGQGIFCYCILRMGFEDSADLKKELVSEIRKNIGPLATPDQIIITNQLPKTRSGKIMRRLLRKIATQETSAEALGDISTLADSSVVQELIEKVNSVLGTK